MFRMSITLKVYLVMHLCMYIYMYIKYGISDYKYLYIVLYKGALTMLIQNRHAISIGNMDCVYEMEFEYEMDMEK